MCVSSLIHRNIVPLIVCTLHNKCKVNPQIKHIFITDDLNSFDFYHQVQAYKYVSTQSILNQIIDLFTLYVQ